MKTNYCQASCCMGRHAFPVIIFFELTSAQMYGEGDQKVPVCWEKHGQVFVDTLSLETIRYLTIVEEKVEK